MQFASINVFHVKLRKFMHSRGFPGRARHKVICTNIFYTRRAGIMHWQDRNPHLRNARGLPMHKHLYVRHVRSIYPIHSQLLLIAPLLYATVHRPSAVLHSLCTVSKHSQTIGMYITGLAIYGFSSMH